MASKVAQKVINPTTGNVENEITDNGIWVLADGHGLRSDIPASVFFSKGSGADPVGATVAVGVRTRPGAPVQIEDATLVLPSLANGSAGLGVDIYPRKQVCFTVTDYVAAIIPEVVQ
jgi:hypothetical protein